ncbi:pyridoxamine 5'-phosphate oxidase [Methylonatrum kenyense]|uniref:pyridoxamine 5'-phosphate oxidase n=1 Tax=Methylonatrum kenyense TaxID=455253 RepID=UPI0020BE2F21|nr:pyridoxamine 5'-phosphate oxidase [Methylonatrum kenyense]MCK8515558.1 pyridoxamine 5'-phosphate oxidase [Methylonatrum kenyense]
MSYPLREEAIDRFIQLFRRAEQEKVPEHTAMTLATVRADGRPAARIVLLKDVDHRGFVFYTNQRSRKGQDLAVTPAAALCFYWPPLASQVLVEGDVVPVSAAEADAYFASRPRLSQIGAWASEQSRPLHDRQQLEQRVADFERQFAEGPIPRPPDWSGYRVIPRLMEFWYAGDGRLHERERYELPLDGPGRHYLVNP